MSLDLKVHSQTFDFGDGRTATLETGKLARQADGAVTLRMGNAVMLCTVVSNKEPRENASFFPLSVDYQEKFAGAGRIPGGFFKREARLSEYEILICRLVDRALRPLFADGYMNDTQILISLISADPEVMPDALAAFAASAALTLTDIPFAGPISEARVARINGEFKVNPAKSELAEADMDIIVGATMADVTMVEGEMAEVSEQDLIEAIKVGHEAIKRMCQTQLDLAAAAGAPTEKREVAQPAEFPELEATVKSFCSDRINEVARGGLGKNERKEGLKAIKTDLKEHVGELEDEEMAAALSRYYKKLEKELIREMVLSEKRRLDGRDPNEVRPLYMETDLLPSPHGCALFTRGETQAIATVTLGTKDDEQMLDKALGLEFSKFLLHYNFPPFSTGEARPIRGTSRREIGHGNLAGRSIKRVLPSADVNPYTIRIVSDILESNGSSSMATVCAGSMALMDAGVKIKSGVSGIAMGMIADDQGRYTILSDILGDEDHLGDMDFKVTGTLDGICACQMDMKIDGLSYEILGEALNQAKEGRHHILKQMNEVIGEPRSDYKPHAPRMEKIWIDKEFIGAIIGPGGKHIQELQAESNTNINIEEKDGKGEVTIAGVNLEGLEIAMARIKAVTQTAEVGEIYEAKVKSIMPYGAFVEFLPGKEGLLHISEISWKRLETMDDVFEAGEMVKVKLVGIDKRSGKYKLSRKVLIENPYKKQDA